MEIEKARGALAQIVEKGYFSRQFFILSALFSKSFLFFGFADKTLKSADIYIKCADKMPFSADIIIKCADISLLTLTRCNFIPKLNCLGV